MFILELYWSFLRFSSYFGLFPCRLVCDLETGSKKLATIRGCNYLTRYLLYLSLLLGLSYFILLSFDINDGKQSSIRGFTDTFSMYATMLVQILLPIIMAKHMWSLRRDLVNLQDHFQQYSPLVQCSAMRCKITIFFICYIISQNLGAMGQVISMLQNNHAQSLTIKILSLVAFAIQNGLLSWPLVIFQLIFYNLITQIGEWINKLRQSSDRHSMEDYLALLGGVTRTKNMLSGCFFTFTFLTLLLIIFSAYFTISIFITMSHASTYSTMSMALGNSLQIFAYIFIVYHLNMTSQFIKDQFEDLAKSLNDKIGKESLETISINGLSVPRQTAKYVVKELRSFQGFDGLGFFTLGKSLLTSILANFATFFIILLQFKISEIQS